MAVGDVYQLAVNQSLHGISCANVFHFEQTSDTSPGVRPENSLMEAFKEDIVPSWQPLATTDWKINCYTARKVSPGGGPQYLKSESIFGTATGESLAVSTCCLASFYSGQGTPRGRGRKFFTGVPITSANAGRLSGPALTTLTTLIDLLIQAIKWSSDNADFIMRIFSTIDGIKRAIVHAQAKPTLTKQSSRVARIC